MNSIICRYVYKFIYKGIKKKKQFLQKTHSKSQKSTKKLVILDFKIK
jgi:hypothetical protein